LMISDESRGGRTEHHVPPDPQRRAAGRAAVARPVPASGGRAPRRAATGAGRPRHREDHDPGRVGRRPDRAPRSAGRPCPRPHLLAEGGSRSSDANHGTAWANGGHARRHDVPRLLLRAGSPVCTSRGGGRSRPLADRARAGVPRPGDVGGQPRDRAGAVAGHSGSCVPHPGLRGRGQGDAGQGASVGHGSRGRGGCGPGGRPPGVDSGR
jgi:hypothetical protein